MFKFRREIFIFAVFFVILLSPSGYCDDFIKKVITKDDTYSSQSWEVAVNQLEKTDEEKYPEKRKINSKTVRLTLNEYYIPNVSEFLCKGVDYYDWLNELDDPYLNRYKLDLEVDPADERFNLLWKEKF